MTLIPKKRGQLSLEEEKFIRDNLHTLTIDQISAQLNRNTAPIKRYISETKNLIPSNLAAEDDLLKQKLY
jgi:hypothetical protein